MNDATNKATETKNITVEVITGNPELDFLLCGGNINDLPPHVPTAEEIDANAKWDRDRAFFDAQAKRIHEEEKAKLARMQGKSHRGGFARY